MSAPGERVKLKVWRDRAERDDRGQARRCRRGARRWPTRASAASEGGQLGLSLRPLTREERREAKVDAGPAWSRTSTAPAARAGIEAGDVLLAINGKPVQSIEQVKSVLAGQAEERGAAGAARRREDLRAGTPELIPSLRQRASARQGGGAFFRRRVAATIGSPSPAELFLETARPSRPPASPVDRAVGGAAVVERVRAGVEQPRAGHLAGALGAAAGRRRPVGRRGNARGLPGGRGTRPCRAARA